MRPSILRPFPTASLLLLLAGGAAAQEDAAPVAVTFRVNDAFVKDRMLPGVEIALAREPRGAPVVRGTTDASGSLELAIVPGTYYASYALAGFVPVPASETVVERDGQVVTTTLSMMLEAEGRPPDQRRVRIILNWGSDQERHVRDADSHLVCACGQAAPHVFYQAMSHQGDGHGASLDVDDTEWGGPETITLVNPPPGSYPYWVHDFSDGPGDLGGSQVVVRVVFGDVLAGEYRAPPGARSRTWRPFRELVIGPGLAPEIVPFTADELAQGLATDPVPGHAETPEAPAQEPAPGAAAEAAEFPLACGVGLFVVLAALVVISALGRRRRSR